MSNTSAARRSPLSVAGILSLLLGLLLTMLPTGSALAAPPDGQPGKPSSECEGLVYLDKFDFTTRSFTVGSTSGGGSNGEYTFTSSTGITVTYSGDETRSVDWTSSTPIDRVWKKAGKDTNEGVSYDEATSGTVTVQGNAFSHITFCYDEDQPDVEVTPVDPTVTRATECDATDTLTIATTTGVDYLVDGTVTAGGTVIATPGTYAVTAEAQDGYVLSSSGFYVEVTLEATEPCPTDEEATPVEPAVVRATECSTTDTLTIPTTTGVDYLVDGTVTAGGTVIDAPGTYVVTAQAQDGYVLTDAEFSVAVTLEATEPCPTDEEVTPVAPTVTTSEQCEVADTLTVATTTGVRYVLDGDDVSGQVIIGAASGTIVAEALDGYVLAAEATTSFPFDLSDGSEDCVQEPTTTLELRPVCTVAETGTYRFDGGRRTGIVDATVQGGQAVYAVAHVEGDTVKYDVTTGGPATFLADANGNIGLNEVEFLSVAAADPGTTTIAWTDGSDSADQLADPCTEVVTTVAPTVVASEECRVEGSFTIPATEGVTYLDGATVLAAGTYAGPADLTVTAVAADGYVLADDAVTSFAVVVDAAEPCEVTPADIVLASECDVAGTLTVPTTEGVDYLVDGDVVAGGTVLTGPASFLLTARAQDGYVLTSELEVPVELAAAVPCDEEVATVAPTIVQSTECQVEGHFLVPAVTGVDYRIDGDVVAAGRYDGPADLVVTATAQDGFVLAEDAQDTFQVVIGAAEPCPVEVAADTYCDTGLAVLVLEPTLPEGTDSVTITLFDGDEVVAVLADVDGAVELDWPAASIGSLDVVVDGEVLATARQPVCDDVLGEEIENPTPTPTPISNPLPTPTPTSPDEPQVLGNEVVNPAPSRSTGRQLASTGIDSLTGLAGGSLLTLLGLALLLVDKRRRTA